jgi:hypothetical protein
MRRPVQPTSQPDRDPARRGRTQDIGWLIFLLLTSLPFLIRMLVR